MILKYENFILEKLIMESNVIYSSKFKKVLDKMPDNKIAKILLGIENKDLDVISNFFDIKLNNDDVITFTNDRAAQAILNDNKEYVKYTGNRGGWLTNNIKVNGDIFERLGFVPKSETVFQPNNIEIGELMSKLTSEKSGKTWCYVKFTTGEGVYNIDKLKNVVATEDEKKKKVFNSARQEIRVGRAVRALLRATDMESKISNAEIEVFVNEFRAALAIANDVFSRFELVDGDDLGFWYHRKNYEFPHKGNLGSSCQAVGRLDWLEIYIKNPDSVKLLILKSENTDDKIVGRSLIWFADDGKQYMDVIYASNDAETKIFKEYAAAKGYEQLSYRTPITVTIKQQAFEKYPSIDNMRYGDFKNGKISNVNFKGAQYIYWTEDHNGDEEDYDDEDEWDD